MVFILFIPVALKGLKNLEELGLTFWLRKICINITSGQLFI